jgi:hypothetical protein
LFQLVSRIGIYNILTTIGGNFNTGELCRSAMANSCKGNRDLKKGAGDNAACIQIL